MFKNLFNRQAAPVQVAQQSSGKYPAIVEQIHHEFETAADRLLIEAKQHLDSLEGCDKVKAARLSALGFKNTDEVIKAREYDELATPLNEKMQLVEYYRMRYPNNKFITDEQVDQICKKYNLVHAPVSNYKGFVPEEKLKQIEQFKLRKDDLRPVHFENVVFEYPTVQRSEIAEIKKMYPDKNYPVIEGPRTVYIKLRNEYVFIGSYTKREFTMMICAPQKDFDLKGLTKKGFSFFKTERVVVPDPVVLYPVKGGNLILAAWGDEASDPIVVNQNHN